MKKISLTLIAVAMLLTTMSCGNKTAMQQQLDSLQTAYDQRNADYEELNSYLAVIAEGLDSIAAQEGQLFATNATPGESPVLSREQIAKNLAAYKQTLANQRQQIDSLEKKLQGSNANLSRLRTIIRSLNEQLAAKDGELEQLRIQLGNRNVSIEYLMASMKSLEQRNASQQATIAAQQKTLDAQDRRLHEAFVKMGPKKELKELGLLSGGGLLKKSQVDYSNMDQRLFQRIDIRKTKRLEIPYKRAKVLTPVPSDSYSMEERDGYNYLIITNADRFWSVSHYLIIQAE